MTRPVTRLVLDGIELDPDRVLADGFRFDGIAGIIHLAVKVDAVEISYANGVS